jgi:hypothetical protein
LNLLSGETDSMEFDVHSKEFAGGDEAGNII